MAFFSVSSRRFSSYLFLTLSDSSSWMLLVRWPTGTFLLSLLFSLLSFLMFFFSSYSQTAIPQVSSRGRWLFILLHLAALVQSRLGPLHVGRRSPAPLHEGSLSLVLFIFFFFAVLTFLHTSCTWSSSWRRSGPTRSSICSSYAFGRRAWCLPWSDQPWKTLSSPQHPSIIPSAIWTTRFFSACMPTQPSTLCSSLYSLTHSFILLSSSFFLLTFSFSIPVLHGHSQKLKAQRL